MKKTSPTSELRGLLDSGVVMLLDGATGTELDQRGVDISLPLWSARAIIEAPEVLGQIHVDYLIAGADLVTANAKVPARLDAYGQAVFKCAATSSRASLPKVSPSLVANSWCEN